ncbi:Hydrogen cyanide synthase subunit HcnC precursor [Phycisphaerae bacterium RAS1]|nr:Hydrogen cyanide synthase subunit HcnC precursor [Phycisphaerae bacterium RAS1]
MTATNSANDALIIGGGVIGCSIAFRLARAGAHVVLIERARCGEESSWAGAGIVDPGSLVRGDPMAELRRMSVARFAGFVDEVRAAGGVDPEYIACGKLDLILDDNQEASAKRELAAQDEQPAAARGLAPRLKRLTTEQSLAAEPVLASPQARRAQQHLRELRGGLLDHHVVQVRNPRLMAALRAACIAAGVRIIENCAAAALRIDGDRVTGAEMANGVLTANTTILAAGAWSSQLHPHLAALTPVHPVRGQIVLLEQSPQPLRHVLYIGRHYLVGRADGRILVGSTVEPDSGFDKRNTAAGVGELLAVVQRATPGLRDATVVRTWAGLRPGTPDGRPYLGPVPGLSGLIAATGHYRNGVTLAPITAEVVEQIVTRGSAGINLSPFSPGRM